MLYLSNYILQYFISRSLRYVHTLTKEAFHLVTNLWEAQSYLAVNSEYKEGSRTQVGYQI